MVDVIAERRLLLTSLSSNDTTNILIQILNPTLDADKIDYICELRLVDFTVWDRSAFELHGVDSMQALQLALDFKDKILEKLREVYSIDLSED